MDSEFNGKGLLLINVLDADRREPITLLKSREGNVAIPNEYRV